MVPLIQTLLGTTSGLLVLVALLHLFPRLGPPGKAVSNWLCRAPGLDLLITVLTIAPLILAPIIRGGAGLVGAILGQYLALGIWVVAHELAHPAARKGRRIVKVHNELVGPVRNMAALLLMSIGVPVFWLIRVVQWIVYPPLVLLVRMPQYRQGEWVNVSRHKFPHLVGHDRVWCLYCDWMTGLWSIGSEMLRNIESFWCPIRFESEAKCQNCRSDFPDIDAGWVPFSSDSQAAADVVQRKYRDERVPAGNAWFGHPARLTVRGKEVDDSAKKPE